MCWLKGWIFSSDTLLGPAQFISWPRFLLKYSILEKSESPPQEVGDKTSSPLQLNLTSQDFSQPPPPSNNTKLRHKLPRAIVGARMNDHPPELRTVIERLSKHSTTLSQYSTNEVSTTILLNQVMSKKLIGKWTL